MRWQVGPGSFVVSVLIVVMAAVVLNPEGVAPIEPHGSPGAVTAPPPPEPGAQVAAREGSASSEIAGEPAADLHDGFPIDAPTAIESVAELESPEASAGFGR